MRQFTDSEMDDLAAGWRRYKSEYETEPTHIWPFENGFRVGLDHAAAQLAALTTERDSLQEKVTKLENNIVILLKFIYGQITRAELDNEINSTTTGEQQ